MKRKWWIWGIVGLCLFVLSGFGILNTRIFLQQNNSTSEMKAKRQSGLNTNIQTTERGCWQTGFGDICASVTWRFISHIDVSSSTLIAVRGSYKIEWDNTTARGWRIEYVLKFYDKYGLVIRSLGEKNYSYSNKADFEFNLSRASKQEIAKTFIF